MDTETDDVIDSRREPAHSTGKTATAVKAASQRFLDDKLINLKITDAGRFVLDKPLTSLGIAAAVGFIFAGGLTTRPGIGATCHLWSEGWSRSGNERSNRSDAFKRSLSMRLRPF